MSQFVCVYVVYSDAVIIQNGRITDELERIWKEAVMA
jgi:hypothetical protein